MIGNKKQKGFTLMETIVAVTVFLVVVTTVADMYLLYSRSQRVAGSRQKILNETSFILERLGQEARLGQIQASGSFDYNGTQTQVPIYSLDGDLGISGQEIELALFYDNKLIIYVFDATGNLACKNFTGKGFYRIDINGCESLLDFSNMELIDAGFYIKAAGFAQQPRATIYLVIDDLSDRSVKTYNIQTTISSRYY